MNVSESDACLLQRLRDTPSDYRYRYNNQARVGLLQELFNSLACHRQEYIGYFFPNDVPKDTNEAWTLANAQGSAEGAEYSAAARGKPCGHIFRNGEATFRCKTCSLDDTCVLCSKCFESSSHEGHAIYVSISTSNRGCCDCGDQDAWKQPIRCAIHTVLDRSSSEMDTDIDSIPLPPELILSIRRTISRALDYICDVISCSPEQLRLEKTEKKIRYDEAQSRLMSKYYGDRLEPECLEYALVLWNDEKHTETEVREQIRRACKQTMEFGKNRACEINDVGRSIVKYSQSIPELMNVSRTIEQIKITTTIRSSRDTFREQMCGTIIEWLEDISGCHVGGDYNIIRSAICEELLGIWRPGSNAHNTEVGREGIDDHAYREERQDVLLSMRYFVPMELVGIVRAAAVVDGMDVDEDGDGNGDRDEEDDDDVLEEVEDLEEVDMIASGTGNINEVGGGLDEGGGGGDELGDQNFAIPQTSPHGLPAVGELDQEGESSNSSEDHSGSPRIPLTPHVPVGLEPGHEALPHWTEVPVGYNRQPVPLHEDLRIRLRLDRLIRFDLRLWKKARIDLRNLYISTVVAIPEFKRILALRFVGLYTELSQLYLIADREPDHSIIALSVQMLTAPVITSEIVQRGNFLTRLMAILYTFLTTRQVGYPHSVNPMATLAFDTSQVTNPLTNRRMYHFFRDIHYLLASSYVKERIRMETRYTIQFLDLVRLHQGICPNVRAVAEHVEYEAEAWISASLITKEINKMARQFAQAFDLGYGFHDSCLIRAIFATTTYATANAMGWDRDRFVHAEMKDETEFKHIRGFQFGLDPSENPKEYKIIRFSVDKQSISFHHALHYTLSWLIEVGKEMSNQDLRRFLLMSLDKLKVTGPCEDKEYQAEDLALAMFDIPLRVSVWLSQLKTGMWVRNGFSLRHQMQSYRSVTQRDFTYHRDIFLLQTALVTIDPSRMLVNMVDRFNLVQWMDGDYRPTDGCDEGQMLDLTEDFLHLLIITLSDRLPLIPITEEPELQRLRIRRELIHILCFKPMQFSAILTESLSDNEAVIQEVLDEIASYRPPDGLSDYGTFELKDECLEEVDPYISYFTKNQREDIEANNRARIAKKLGKAESEVALEPRISPIKTGAFRDLAAFTRTKIFAQIIYHSLSYAMQSKIIAPNIPDTRVETFLQLCLHLCQIATLEDTGVESESNGNSFILHTLSCCPNPATSPTEDGRCIDGVLTIAAFLHRLSNLQDFKACRAKINYLLKNFKQRRPSAFSLNAAWIPLDDEKDNIEEQNSKEAELQRKKLLAKERQAKIMAQIKQQQQSFLDHSGADFEVENFSDVDGDVAVQAEEKRVWKYPTGTCILCQEDMNESRLYGTLAFVTDSNILRQTDPEDADYVSEVVMTPDSLDRCAQDIRPFGVASMNRQGRKKLGADGSEIIFQRQGLGRGFPQKYTTRGPVAVSCSHMMHYGCFDHYYESTRRRHPFQIARNHPENLLKKQFVCPLCKALGNAFFPIIWKAKEETPVGVIQSEVSFESWLADFGPMMTRLGQPVDGEKKGIRKRQEMFVDYGSANIVNPISNMLSQLSSIQPEDWRSRISPSTTPFGSNAPPSTSPTSHIEELQKAYLRLCDTYRNNDILSDIPIRAPSAELTHCDALARTLGFSISAIEIAQRGVGSEPGQTLLDKISPQILAGARILAETISSYFAVGALQAREATMTMVQFNAMQNSQLERLFLGHHVYNKKSAGEIARSHEPLLSTDSFLFLAECTLCSIPGLSWDFMHVVRLCYIAEVVKVVVAFTRDCDFVQNMKIWEEMGQFGGSDERFGYTKRQLLALQNFVAFIESSLGGERRLGGISHFGLAVVRLLIGKYATPFLRKTVILVHTKFGVIFSSGGFSELDEPERARLCKLLQLPHVDEIIESVLKTPDLQSIVDGWCSHLTIKHSRVKLSHPAIFELVGLPKQFDILVEEGMKRRCPTNGTEMTDPCVCLFCGDIFCSQASCCITEIGNETDGFRKIGGCNQHTRQCGMNIGIFINIRKCALLHLHDHNGAWAETPYMDMHGETDFCLRRGRQLFLNQRRYDALIRTVWLQHGIPTVISRRLESEMNTGGWDSL